MRHWLVAVHHQWQDWCGTLRFANPALEAAFQVQEVQFALALLRLWTVLHMVAALIVIASRFRSYACFHDSPLALALHLLSVLLAALPALGVHFVPPLRAYARQLLFAASLLFVVWCGWSFAFLAEYNVRFSSNSLTSVWPLLEASPDATTQLSNLLETEQLRRQAWLHVLLVSQSFVVLQPLGLAVGSVVVYLSLPVMVGATNCAMTNRAGLWDVVLTCGVITVVSAYASWYWQLTRRRQFGLDRALQRTLAKEAEAMQQLVAREKTHKETSQHADTILNHILTNLMVDAAGCIHLYLHSLGPYPAPELLQAISCLDRGMNWCQRRQALLRLVSEEYTLAPTKVHLSTLAKELSQGRQMTFTPLDEWVCIDKLLCEIVLDHALSYALRHGHPHTPQLHLAMQLEHLDATEAAPSPDGVLRLTFRITNRANPGHTVAHVPDLVAHVLRTQTAPPATEDVGLRHMAIAADCHCMSLSLQQVVGTLVLQASLEVQATPSRLVPLLPSPTGVRAHLPARLKILCIDDSEVSRRLLSHTLSRTAPDCEVVAYGAEAADVERFCRDAIAADILILDQHLEYGHITFLGSELLRSLQAQGFVGFACIRSANVDPDAVAEYLRCGAHASLGKDLPPLALVGHLAEAYHTFVAQRAVEPSSSDGAHPLPGAVPDGYPQPSPLSPVELGSCAFFEG